MKAIEQRLRDEIQMNWSNFVLKVETKAALRSGGSKQPTASEREQLLKRREPYRASSERAQALAHWRSKLP